MSLSNSKHHTVLQSQEFKKLVSNRWTFSLVLTLIILFVYIGFLLLVAFNKELLGSKINTHLTLAIPVGIGIIILAWVLTGIYVYWANNTYDKAVQDIKSKLS
ncbi:DUF485 domain-containing protein [Adhaeribacter aquaticus]|uniref:DUF485 domain-containing protein n=1 Tax=Adhaeribacter aquaticus TaxID=299567 RepID=UPI000413EA86|nr:DUF485 domain-containing protein [Adhaeribacter aquaticus]